MAALANDEVLQEGLEALGLGEVVFPRVQGRIMAVLLDGLPHTARELHGCLADELGPARNVCAHLTHIRGRIRPFGYDVLLQGWRVRPYVRDVRGGGRFHYRLVKLLSAPEKF